jgi:hypothetical protein
VALQQTGELGKPRYARQWIHSPAVEPGRWIAIIILEVRSLVVRSLALIVLTTAPAASLLGQERERPLEGLSRADLANALRDSLYGWVRYESDGSARSDTARRLAARGMWDLEGGDQQRGLRLVAAAWRLGVADSLFYREMVVLMRIIGCPAEEVTVAVAAHRRWPGSAWADSAYVQAVAARERVRPAPQRRECPMRLGGAAPTK